MSATLAPGPETVSRQRLTGLTWQTTALGALGLILLLSVVRLVTGADDITSSGTTAAALGLAVPIGMAGLGGLWSERAGVVNIGLEGMMILGTWCGAWAGYHWGPWAGLVAGAVGGALGGLLHAIATVSFGVDHIVSGVAINILGLGVTQFLSVLAFEGEPGGSTTQSPPLKDFPTVSLPGLSDPLHTLEEKGWFFVSDVAGILRGLTTNVSLFTLIAVILVPATFFVLWRTAFGLRLRSCGENPGAAESLGVNVYKYKYIAVMASGAFAGIGGAFLSIVAAGIYREGQTAGRGFIGLAAMIFGNWRPAGLAAGAGLFGYTDALQLRRGGESVHALLLLVALILVAVAIWHAIRGRPKAALIAVGAAAVVFVIFIPTNSVPGQFTSFAPHLATLLVLSISAQRLRMPKADGRPYRRGEQH
ncbi:MAG TPA: ABC transporter permease [Streptosporangiaceae bacterium]|jgi:simple sugar transport system permease protein